VAGSWKKERAEAHIETRIGEVDEVEIVDYTRDTTLESIATARAYRVDGVHVYADILNLGEMLDVTAVEGETCHKRALRFLDLHYRAVDRITESVGARRVDLHNQRLHAVVVKPYNTQDGAETERVNTAVAMADLLVRVLAAISDEDEHVPPAKVRVGIDTGEALAVNNGRSGGREPLFLGHPANYAAKLSGGGKATGIYLSNEAREAIGLSRVQDPKSTKLASSEIADCVEAANLDIDADEVIEAWREDMEARPLGAISFTAHTPPLRTLDIKTLTPGNSRRQDAVSVYADIDGFTDYIARHIDDSAEAVVKVFHVIRAELDRVLSTEFGGRRIRFIGDCIHGLLCEGTAAKTDDKATIETATLCAGALRSSFRVCLEMLGEDGVDTDGLDLAIGFEYGPMTVTRLGMKGRRVRCSVSRGVLASEKEQRRCGAEETAIGAKAHDLASTEVRDLFGNNRLAEALDYEAANAAISGSAKSQPAAQQGGGLLRAPSSAGGTSVALSFPAQAAGPSKPAGFA
jgi:class 3 adenylate cyclase